MQQPQLQWTCKEGGGPQLPPSTVEPLKRRPKPDMYQDPKSLSSKCLQIPPSDRSATNKIYCDAYNMLEELQQTLEDNFDDSNDNESMYDLSSNDEYIQCCSLLIRITTMTDYRIGIPGHVCRMMMRSQQPYHITSIYPLVSTDIQLVRVSVRDWIALLAHAIAMFFIKAGSSIAIRIIHELHAHAKGGYELEWDELESDPSTLGLSEEYLRFALATSGVKITRQMYRNKAERSIPGLSAQQSSADLLQSIQILALEMIQYQPESPRGHWNLGYVAQESVAKLNWHGLTGAKERFDHLTKAYQLADAQDDDFVKATARIDAAICLCFGAGGRVSYTLPNGEKGHVSRRFDRASVREVTSGNRNFKLNLTAPSKAGEKMVMDKELDRIRRGVEPTQLDPGERLLVARWDVLRLWNDAMESYDALQKWGHHEFVYGECNGFDSVQEMLVGTINYAPTQYMGIGGEGFPGRRDKGFGNSKTNGCANCGKTKAKLQKCARCKQVAYW